MVGTDTHIVADIGGTNARFAYIEGVDGRPKGVEVFPCADFTYLIDAVKTYMENSLVVSPSSICLAVAGPVEGDWIDLPNNHWAFSQREIAARLGTKLRVINDFSAQVLSIEALEDSQLHWFGPNRPSGSRAKAVIGPGTGLGVSAMLRSGEILPSEGGHVAFAPLDEHEADLLRVLRERFPRVSAERVLSGPGLANLYWANCRLDGLERELPSPEITAGARAGDSYCQRAVTDFFAILASFAGDIALMTCALDGVYLSGGILPRIKSLLNEDFFLQRFQDKGRFSSFTASLPLALIEAEHPGLIGCARALIRDTYENDKALRNSG